ncbi:hypothetical protein CIRG_05393 [Coccidioides immitis RMSCC 2394]|uniref:Uncharacterized protein n=1 Tax=Coccidioides immitis RMSCC 2394 TaxID=404692 RepID=A0A0J7B6X3_COCIT|nr:hypothetical protein CIRG_05393 [Coccidioides immitis RMSCC 2394]
MAAAGAADIGAGRGIQRRELIASWAKRGKGACADKYNRGTSFLRHAVMQSHGWRYEWCHTALSLEIFEIRRERNPSVGGNEASIAESHCAPTTISVDGEVNILFSVSSRGRIGAMS